MKMLFVLSLQPMIPSNKRFDISPLCGMLRRSRDAFRFFFKKKNTGANCLDHKERYDIITDEEWYILVKV